MKTSSHPFVLPLLCIMVISQSVSSKPIKDWEMVSVKPVETAPPVQMEAILPALSKAASETQILDRSSLEISYSRITPYNSKPQTHAFMTLSEETSEEEPAQRMHFSALTDGTHTLMLLDLYGDHLINFMIDPNIKQLAEHPTLLPSVDVNLPHQLKQTLTTSSMNVSKLHEVTHACQVRDRILLLTKEDAEVLAHPSTPHYKHLMRPVALFDQCHHKEHTHLSLKTTEQDCMHVNRLHVPTGFQLL